MLLLFGLFFAMMNDTQKKRVKMAWTKRFFLFEQLLQGVMKIQKTTLQIWCGNKIFPFSPLVRNVFLFGKNINLQIAPFHTTFYIFFQSEKNW